MKEYDKLNEAMDEISDQYLKEAGESRRKKRIYWPGAIAASLAAVLLVGILSPLMLLPVLFSAHGSAGPQTPAGEQTPTVVQPTQKPQSWFDSLLTEELVAAPEYPDMAAYPQDPNGAYDTPAYNNWQTGLKAQYGQPEDYADGLEDFFSDTIPLFLAESEDNAVCSPLNIYMALAMLAETTGGESRDSILAALNADSIESLRSQAGHVWNAHYRADGASACLLANSLWLNEGYNFNRSTVDTLADSYYASVYQGALGSDTMNNVLRDWLSSQTQGLLDQYIQGVELSPEDALALASTVYFQAKWDSQFWANRNTIDVFHSPAGDVEATYMNDTLTYGPYYYGEDYGAVCLGFDPAGVYGQSAMWLILPDEGYEPWDVLESGYAMDMILNTAPQDRDSTTIKVHLSLPKFDISAETDLRESMTALGLGDLFSETAADFSAILPETEGAHLGKTSHAARVAIDEEGVTAAAYTVIYTAGAPLPPEEEVYFTLDRPFIFVITSADNLPLFVGVVNNP